MFTRKEYATSVSGKTANGCPVRSAKPPDNMNFIFFALRGETLRGISRNKRPAAILRQVLLRVACQSILTVSKTDAGRTSESSDQLLPEAAGVVELCRGGVQLLRLPVRRLQGQRQWRRWCRPRLRADNQRSAVRAGNRAGDGKAEAGVGVDGLHLAARLGQIQRASEAVARRCRVVDFNDGDGRSGKKRKGDFGSPPACGARRLQSDCRLRAPAGRGPPRCGRSCPADAA